MQPKIYLWCISLYPSPIVGNLLTIFQFLIVFDRRQGGEGEMNRGGPCIPGVGGGGPKFIIVAVFSLVLVNLSQEKVP
jgi:hypothetical protein